MTNTTGRLYALAAALLFSTGGAGLKADAFSAAQMSALRSGIAAVALLIWLGGRVRLSPLTVGAAVLYAGDGHDVCRRDEAHNRGARHFSPVGGTALPGAARSRGSRRARPSGRDLAYIALVGIGLWFCFSGGRPRPGTAPDPETGNLLALSAA